MMYQLDLVQVGRMLVMKGREANREVLQYYGSENAVFTHRNGFNAQIALLRGLGIGCEAETDGNAGKELYTKIVIFDGSGHSKEFTL